MPLMKFVPTTCLVLSILPIGAAAAEEWRYGAAQIICDPEHGHFDLRTLEIFEPNKEMNEARNIYLASALAVQPFRCALPKNLIEVQGVDEVVSGPCGYRAGQKVRVLINGVPVAHRFEATSTMSSTTDLSKGWIAASSCFEWEHRVEIRAEPITGEWTMVELCRVESEAQNTIDRSDVSLSGSCKSWSNIGERDKEFPFD